MDQFSYKDVQVSPSPADPSGTVWRPILTIAVHGLTKTVRVPGLLDTGAMETILPLSLWDTGEIDPAYREGEVSVLVAANGTPIPVRYATVDLAVRLGNRRHRWHAKVGFSADRDEAVLGHAGFLRFFAVAFYRRRRFFTIRPDGPFPPPIMPS